MLVCLPEQYPPPLFDFSAGKIEMLTAAAMFGVVAAAALAASWTRRQLMHHPGRRESVLRHYNAWRLFHTVALCAAYAVTLSPLVGWGWAVEEFCQVPHPGAAGTMTCPGAELLVLGPFVVGLVLSWACFYDAERAIHDTSPSADRATPFWTRGTYLGFNIRHTLGLVFIPVVFMIGGKAFRRQFPGLEQEFPVLISVASLALLGVIFVSLPWMLRLVLGLRSLPEGELRQRLLSASRRLDFRCSDILLWNTRGIIANAMVVGVLPVVRYVLLTDRLVAELTPDEIEAVFGHEVGHVKHHHMIYYVGFLFISLGVVLGLWELVSTMLGMNTDAGYLSALPCVGLLGTYIFVVFGFLSRRCERQADIYGCRAVSCGRSDCGGHDPAVLLLEQARGLCPTGIRTFIAALEKVARLNGISRDRPGLLQSWQHSTIARRVEFLQHVLAEPAVEVRFQRAVGLVKWSLLLALVAALILLVLTNGWQVLL
jgi:Zn-dependent protease with chaperone function